MPELLPLRPEVADVLRRRLRLERDAFADPQAVPLEPGALARVVRQQPHRADADVVEDLRADPVIALVRLEAQLEVRLDGVAPTVLQLVRPELVGDPDRSP